MSIAAVSLNVSYGFDSNFRSSGVNGVSGSSQRCSRFKRHRRRFSAPDQLLLLIARLIQGAQELGFRVRSDNSAIVNIIAGDIDSLILATNVLWDDGIKITPAMFPAVPLDEGGLRFTVTASNTQTQIADVLQSLARSRALLSNSQEIINLRNNIIPESPSKTFRPELT